MHVASDDFAATVSKARHFVDASKLSRAHKKLAIRTTSPSVNYQTIVDGVMEALVLHDQGRTRRSMYSRSLLPLPARVHGTRRILLARDYRQPVMHLREVPDVLHPLVVRFVSRIRVMISLHANPMVLPVVIVGRATSRRNTETTMALGDRCQP